MSTISAELGSAIFRKVLKDSIDDSHDKARAKRAALKHRTSKPKRTFADDNMAPVEAFGPYKNMIKR